MSSEDFTFCMKDDCDNMKCFRNPKHIKLLIPHSYAWLEGTDDCLNTNRQSNKDKCSLN